MFTLEVLASIFNASATEETPSPSTKPNTLVLIPAHNEEEVITYTLERLRENQTEFDNVLVVADNCTDTTADIVRKHGFMVSERKSEIDRGKGYALAHGIAQAAAEGPPDILIILDADCIPDKSAIEGIARLAHLRSQAVQSMYLIKHKGEANLKERLSEFAFLVKNHVRSLGLSKLGGSVHLLGSGMAFPWQQIKAANLGSSEIVEDMKLGIEQVIQNRKTLYSPKHKVFSTFPETELAQQRQRERWEHGHLGMIQKYFSPLIKTSIKGSNLSCAMFAFDLLIPPLTLLIAIVLLVNVFGIALALIFGNVAFFVTPLLLLITIFIGVALSWLKYAREILRGRDLLMVPVYIVSKLSLYFSFIFKRQTKWIRTDRK